MVSIHEQVRASQHALSAVNLQQRGVPGSDYLLDEVLAELEILGSLAGSVATAIRAFLTSQELATCKAVATEATPGFQVTDVGSAVAQLAWV